MHETESPPATWRSFAGGLPSEELLRAEIPPALERIAAAGGPSTRAISLAATGDPKKLADFLAAENYRRLRLDDLAGIVREIDAHYETACAVEAVTP